MQQSMWPSQYSLPLPRPRLHSDTRPHTVHSSSSDPLPRAAEYERQTRGSLAALGILPEAATDRRLSRDDTAADVSEWITQPGPSRASKSEMNLVHENEDEDEEVSCVWPEGFRFDQFRAPRPQRRSVFRSHDGGAFTGQTTSLGRRFSRTKDKVAGFRDNVLGGKIRRQSIPHSADAVAGVQKFANAPVSTSPSKRNGKHEGDRPTKLNRHVQSVKSNDRKDTPAPPPFAAGGQASRPATSSLAMSLPGGERARQAAAASKTSPVFNIWNGTDDLNTRRGRLGSNASAADSGADLSTYSTSNSSYKDSDGDIEMASDDVSAPPLVRDFLRVLPDELSLQVFEFLDAKDLVTCERVDKRWRAMVLKRSVWRSAFLRRYQRQIFTNPAPVQVGGVGCGRPGKPDQDWRRMYKAHTELDSNWRKGPKDAGKAIYLAGHTDSVYCLQFDEEKIITGSRDRTIRVWDINNFTCQRVIGGPNVKPVVGPKVLRTVDYPDFHLATASVNGTAYGNTIFHTPKQWHDASILCLQYDDQILVTGSSDSDLLVWDIHTYEPIKRLQQHTGGVLDVALDAKHIVSCSKDSKIIVWRRDTYESKGELTGHRGPVNAVQLRGKYLVSASGDGIARLWDIETMKLVKEFTAKERGLAAVEFSEDMKYVLAGGNDTITYKFETWSGNEVKQFTGHSQLVRSLWLDSHNSRVVSGSYDLDLRVYDFDTGEEIWRAEEWTTSWMLAAKSDYRRVVATSQDGRILIIDMGLQKCRTPDDGQPIDGVDLLRGNENTNAIEWINPWERERERQRRRELQSPQHS